MKREVSNNTSNLEKMQLKVALLEDQDRRNNMRITGIATGREGGDAIAFLQDMLPKWIPSLNGVKIQIEHAHRIRCNKKNGQATMIFKVLGTRTATPSCKGLARQGKRVPYKTPGGQYGFMRITAHSQARGGRCMER